MKVILVGAIGETATEVIRQALSHPEIISLVSLGRHETTAPNDLGPAEASKLRSCVCEDLCNYPETVKKELADADVCIW